MGCLFSIFDKNSMNDWEITVYTGKGLVYISDRNNVLEVEMSSKLMKSIEKMGRFVETADVTFEGVLGLCTKDIICKYLDNMKVTYKKSSKKGELISLYMSVTYDEFRKYAMTMTDEQCQMLIENPGRMDLSNLSKRVILAKGWAHLIINDSDDVMFIPKEIRELCIDIVENNADHIKSNSNWSNQIAYALSKYGVLKLRDLLAGLVVSNDTGIMNIGHEALVVMTENLEFAKVIREDTIEESLLYHDFLLEVVQEEKIEDLYQVINGSNANTYGGVETKSLSSFAENSYLVTDALKLIKAFVVELVEDEAELVDYILREMAILMAGGQTSDYVLDMTAGMLDLDENEYKKLDTLVAKAVKQAGKWAYKGQVSVGSGDLVDLVEKYYKDQGANFNKYEYFVQIEGPALEHTLDMAGHDHDHDHGHDLDHDQESESREVTPEEGASEIAAILKKEYGYRKFGKNMALSGALKILNKKDITELAMKLLGEKAGRFTKTELIPKLKETIEKSMAENFKYMPTEFLVELRDNGSIATMACQYSYDIAELGFGFEYFTDKEFATFVPKDIRSAAGQYLESNSILADANAWIYKGVEFACWQYGMISMVDLKEIIMADLQEDLSDFGVASNHYDMVLDFAIRLNDNSELVNGKLCQSDLMMDVDIEEIEAGYKLFKESPHDYQVITKADVETFQDGQIYGDLEAYYEAYGEDKPMEIYDMVHELRLMAGFGVNFEEEVTIFLEDHKFELSFDVFKLNQLKKLMIQTVRTLPNWFYKGKSIAEMGILQQSADENGKLIPIIKDEKIGRNDPCPCGSGKKYKKCCLNK